MANASAMPAWRRVTTVEAARGADRVGRRQIQAGGSLAGNDCSEATSTGLSGAAIVVETAMRVCARRPTLAMSAAKARARSGAFMLAVPVTRVRNVEPTASVASSSIDIDCRRDRSSTVSVPAELDGFTGYGMILVLMWHHRISGAARRLTGRLRLHMG
jgi:hypothetical protein